MLTAENLLLFFEQHPDPAWVYDRETLQFLRVNSAAIAHYGYSAAEFLAMTLDTVQLHPEPEVARRFAARVDVEERVNPVWCHLKKCGERTYADVRYTHVTDGGRPARLAMMRDVSGWLVLEQEAADAKQRAGEAAITTSALQRIAGRVAKLGAWRVTLATSEVWWSEETAKIHEIPNITTMSAEYGLSFYLEESGQRMREAFDACLVDGQPYDELVQVRTAKGNLRWVRVIGEPELDQDGVVGSVLGACLDVTEQVDRQEASSLLARRLQGMLDTMSDGFFAVDRDLRLTFVNQAFLRMLGGTHEQYQGVYLWTAFPDARGTVFEERMERIIKAGEPASYEVCFPPTGAWFSVSAYPSDDGVGVYFRDIKERKQADERLRESENRFQLLAAATQDIVWDWDIKSDSVWWNARGLEVLGQRASQSSLKDAWLALIHPDDRQRVSKHLQRFLDGAETVWEDEYRLTTDDGAASAMMDRGNLIRSESGEPLRMLNSMLDVSERNELAARLRQSQKLEAVGQLTGGIAHDFNNLLTVILGNSELIVELLAGEEHSEVRKFAAMCVSAAERGSEMTERLLAFARKQPLSPQVIQMKTMLASLDLLLRRSLGEDVELETMAAAGLWQAQADPAQLEAALLNLAVNARDAMPTGGRLTIETSNAVLDEDYAQLHAEVVPGQYVLISVSDTGLGMSGEVQRRLFEPFYTTKPAGKGSGLGMSMIYGFMKQSGGHVSVYSELGEGTTVRLYVPRADISSGALFRDTQPAWGAKGGSEHILVVEDDDLVREHVINIVESLGYRVSNAESGDKALAILGGEEDIELLFTDVIMPGGLNGRQLADIALRDRPQLKVLFTSGYTENAIVHHGRLDPDVELLAKPYRRHELAAKLRKILDRDPPAR